MIKLTASFKKEIKLILLNHYNINCYKISDETNYSGNSGMFVLHLYCEVNNSKFPLFLNMPRPTESSEEQELYIDICCYGNSIMYVQGIFKKFYTQELNFVFEQSVHIFETLGHKVNFSVMRDSSVSLIHGDCYFKNKKFDLSMIQPNVHSEHKIYVQSQFFNSQIELCNSVIYGDKLKLSNKNFDLQYDCNLFEKESDYSFLVYLLKSYVLLLKNRLQCLDSITIDNIEHASFDDLTNMMQIFEMERI